jgi:sulfate adenylyltransferase
MELGIGAILDYQVPPHGGILNPLLAEEQERARLCSEAQRFPAIPLTSREASDLIMLATGAFSPLDGFIGKADYESVVHEMRLTTGLLWPVPITVSVSPSEASRLNVGQDVALIDPERGRIVAFMHVSEKFSRDKREEASLVYGTDDVKHPGVANLYRQGDVCLGGPVQVLEEGQYRERFPEYARPEDTRRIFRERGWATIAALQTRNPMHRSHEYLAKIALEVCDGLLIHPIVGKLKDGDIPAEVRMECYRALLGKYLPADRVVLKVYPMEMRYAGPREALLHAIIRQNFGCSHLIVGRDHAGVGKYYGPFESQTIFDRLNPGDLHIRPLKLDWTFWCSKCDGMASMKTCPHGEEDRLLISGTKLRSMLMERKAPPAQFSRPEVVDILLRYYERTSGGTP